MLPIIPPFSPPLTFALLPPFIFFRHISSAMVFAFIRRHAISFRFRRRFSPLRCRRRHYARCQPAAFIFHAASMPFFISLRYAAAAAISLIF